MTRLCLMIGVCVLLVSVQSKHFVKFSYEEMRDDGEQDSVPMMELLKPLNVLRFQPAWRLRGFSWNDCGKPSKVVTLTNLAVTPDPIKAGGSAQASVQGKVLQTVTSPLEADVTVYRKSGTSWSHIYSTVFPDICSKPLPGTCPIKQGPISLTKSSNVPNVIPAGEFNVTVNFKFQGTWLACFQVIADISH